LFFLLVKCAKQRSALHNVLRRAYFFYGNCNGYWKCLTVNMPAPGWYCGSGTSIDEWGRNYFHVAWALDYWDAVNLQVAVMTYAGRCCEEPGIGGVQGYDCFFTGVNRRGGPFFSLGTRKETIQCSMIPMKIILK